LHLTAASQVVTNDGLVVRIEGVGVFGLDHYLVGLEQALLACLEFLVLLCAQLFDCLFVEAGEETHELFVTIYFFFSLDLFLKLNLLLLPQLLLCILARSYGIRMHVNVFLCIGRL
jgi:hypothetical protein